MYAIFSYTILYRILKLKKKRNEINLKEKHSKQRWIWQKYERFEAGARNCHWERLQ